MKVPVLNRPLVLEARVEAADGAGGLSATWQALGTLWAHVEGRTGRELRDGARMVSRAGYRITVRAAPVGAPSRPRPDQRFREGARVFRIRAVMEAEASSRFLLCLADEELGT